ncbi:hypothetical protein HPB48_022262 [Haemaphysalis longicornis]|uniref:FP protein C-terminal domain-containing protein n=1 Tax=Haemaphysalis longicornis TaxID=44386 RepID=A0A9J6FMS7_HAELO|nr:hypothetical protein HPB48_022262 [Haemaphysalis longicornis]
MNGLGFSANTAVFVNEHLFPALKKLLGVSIAKKRECQWQFVWAKEGRILAKRDEQSNAIHIQSEQDVEMIV